MHAYAETFCSQANEALLRKIAELENQESGKASRTPPKPSTKPTRANQMCTPPSRTRARSSPATSATSSQAHGTVNICDHAEDITDEEEEMTEAASICTSTRKHQGMAAHISACMLLLVHTLAQRVRHQQEVPYTCCPNLAGCEEAPFAALVRAKAFGSAACAGGNPSEVACRRQR